MKSFDAVILGGGIIGLTMAVQGVRQGQRILLVDKNQLGYGASGAGSGILMTHSATQFHSLFREMYVRSVNEYYPSFIDFLNENNAKCLDGSRPLKIRQTGSWQFYSMNKKFEQLKSQLEREASQGFELLNEFPAQFNYLLQSEVLSQGVHFPEETIIHNGEMLAAIRQFLHSSELAEVVEGMECLPAWKESDKMWSIDLSRSTISSSKVQQARMNNVQCYAQNLVLTSGAWADDILRSLGFESRMTPVRGQLAWFKHPEIQLTTSIHMDGHFYAVPRDDGFILGATTEAREWDQSFLESGEDFLNENIHKYLQSDFHGLKYSKAWAGLRPRSRDRKPLMGAVDENRRVWMSAGHI